MNKCLTCFLLVFLFFKAGALGQVYSLNNGFTNGGVVSACNGIFKDSNGGGEYKNNENYSVTFLPGTVGTSIEFRFDTLALAVGDTLWIYDGPTLLAPTILFFSANDGSTTVRGSATNTSGALTIRFTSDNAITNKGWSASIFCKPPCQSINANISFTIPASDANGFINICTGQSVFFKGRGIYNDNDLIYHQSDSSSKFKWRVTDSKDTTGIFLDTFRHRFTREGGFIIELRITDTAGCINTNRAFIKVRTGIRPEFNLQIPPRNCSTDTIRIRTRPKMMSGSFVNPPVVADSIFLPDGTNIAYQTTLNINQFLPGQTLNDLNDLKGILVNMEHSWLGDFEIAIKAPSGVTVRLKYSTGVGIGWESFLGEPVDEPSSSHPFASIAGKGYSYVFSPNPTFGTMASERGRYRYSYIDNAGQTQNNHTYLPAGSYASEESLAPLVGTELNGQWTITVIDKFSVDNGFIFYWTLQFAPTLYPSSEIYATQFGSGSWSPGLNILTGSDSLVTIISNTPGSYPYQYSITDNFGCRHDTAFTLVVFDKPVKPTLGRDTAICDGLPINLQVNNVQGGQIYSWSTGAAGSTSISINQPGIYWVSTSNLQGCSNRDTILAIASTPYSVTLGPDTTYCTTGSNVLRAVTSIPIAKFVWSNNTTADNLPITAPGNYWVETVNAAGCKVRDTILVTENNINTFELPADSSICDLIFLQLNLQPPAGAIITWNDGSIGNIKNLVPGNYSIQANYRGCIKSSDIIVGMKPLPRINLGRDTSICFGFTVPLSVSYPGATYLWSNGRKDSNITIGAEGKYWVQTMLNGCTYRDTLELKTRDCACEVKVPNAFSPNGDGVNDFFVPVIKCFPQRYQLSIFNRYGQLIFDTRSYTHRWDGKLNGNVVAIGTYYYIITFYNENLKKDEKYPGSITLLR